MIKTDLKDRKIISELEMDARMPLSELANKVGLSRQVVEYRLKRMKKEGLIFGAVTIFDSAVVGFNIYRIAFRLIKITEKEKKEFIEFLKNSKYAFWLGEAGGNWDLVMNVAGKDIFQFNKIFEDIASKYGTVIRDYEILIYINIHDYERNYILERGKERGEFFHEMKFNPRIKLDEADKNIIKLISKNALMTNIEIGQKLNVSGNTIRNRINLMVKNKLILGFRLFINPSAFGYKSHMLFLEVKKMDFQKEKELHSYLKTIPNIIFVVKHIGKYRIGMEIETKDEEEFQKIFVDIRGRFNEIITGFESFPIFKDHVINYFPEGCLD